MQAEFSSSGLKLDLTVCCLAVFRSHPPAGTTTLIVSLGIISKPRELLIIEVAVFLLVAQALVINRLAGLPYPIWNAVASINPVNED
jgi:CBS domain-containing membrane protein